MNQTAIKQVQTDWITLFKENENQALREIYYKYRTDCLRHLTLKHCISSEEAKEIFQLSIIVLYNNVMTGKLTTLKGSVKSYILGIGSNKVFELYRSNQREHKSKTAFTKMISAIASEGAHEENEYFLKKVNAIKKALLSIGDPCRSILRMFYFNKMSMGDITSYFGYKNENTTKNLKYKCIQRIKKVIDYGKG